MRASACLIALLCAPGLAAAQTPLSAIDWLDEQRNAREAPVLFDEPAVARDASVPQVEVQPLESDDAAPVVGLLPPAVTGLPETLWAGSSGADVARMIRAHVAQPALPAAQSLFLTLLLAEAQPPKGDATSFMSARLAALTARGALTPAAELMRLLSAQDRAALEDQAAELALLTGETTALCAEVVARRSLATDLSLRVYCLAQTGAWNEAVTTLEAGLALGDLTPARHGRLLRFLEPELAEELPAMAPPPPTQMRALDFRLLAAIGEPVATTRLPLPYAQSDLSGDAGWKARLEASERLVRAGAIGEAQLFAAYTERVPAASGGVWDRAEAVQRFDIAVRARDPGAIAANLPNAWRSLRDAGLSVAFAKAYGAALLAVNLPADVGELQLRLGLLAPEYEQFAAKIAPQDPTLQFAVTLARGAPTSDVSDPLHAAIAEAWSTDVAVAEDLQTKRESGDLGPVILRSLERLDTGARGDMRALTQGLAALRGLGLEDVARRAALQTLLTSFER